MSTIVTRAGKGSPLTHNEVDANFTNLNTDKYQSGDDVSFGNATFSGYLRGPATFVIDPAAHGDATGTLQVLGNLQVDGTTTTINSTTLEVTDLNITVAKDAANAAAANEAGLLVGGAGAEFLYAATGDKWTMNKPLDVTGAVTATSFSGNGASVTNVDAATLGGDSKATILASAQADALALAIALG